MIFGLGGHCGRCFVVIWLLMKSGEEARIEVRLNLSLRRGLELSLKGWGVQLFSSLECDGCSDW